MEVPERKREWDGSSGNPVLHENKSELAGKNCTSHSFSQDFKVADGGGAPFSLTPAIWDSRSGAFFQAFTLRYRIFRSTVS